MPVGVAIAPCGVARSVGIRDGEGLESFTATAQTGTPPPRGLAGGGRLSADERFEAVVGRRGERRLDPSGCWPELVGMPDFG